MLQPGRYRHYKGQEYEVLGVARHSETEEEYVVYRAGYGSDQRPCSWKPCSLTVILVHDSSSLRYPRSLSESSFVTRRRRRSQMLADRLPQ